jgi:hypothetical protein
VRTAKKFTIGALAAVGMALMTPITPANADQGDTLNGGCGFNTNQNSIATNGQNEGVIFVTALSNEAAGGPSTATVSCWIDVNGVEQGGTRLTVTGTGPIVGQQQISFSAGDTDFIAECQEVVFADGSTWTAPDGNVGVDCSASASVGGSPQLDQLLCPVFVALYAETNGGVLGVLRISSGGDLYLANPTGTGYTKIWDCP